MAPKPERKGAIYPGREDDLKERARRVRLPPATPRAETMEMKRSPRCRTDWNLAQHVDLDSAHIEVKALVHAGPFEQTAQLPTVTSAAGALQMPGRHERRRATPPS